MKKLLNTARIVEEVLTDYPETRNDDNLLWLKVLEIAEGENNYPGINTRPDICDLTVDYLLKNVRYLKLPSYETVSRSRRKIQAKNPELRGTERVTKSRAFAEELYREFAKS